MDQTTLELEAITEGEQVLRLLNDSSFEVRTAFWARDEEKGTWSLYIAAPEVDSLGPRKTYRRLNALTAGHDFFWFSPLEIHLISPNDPIVEKIEPLKSKVVSTKSNLRRYLVSPFAEVYVYPAMSA